MDFVWGHFSSCVYPSTYFLPALDHGWMPRHLNQAVTIGMLLGPKEHYTETGNWVATFVEPMWTLRSSKATGPGALCFYSSSCPMLILDYRRKHCTELTSPGGK